MFPDSRQTAAHPQKTTNSRRIIKLLVCIAGCCFVILCILVFIGIKTGRLSNRAAHIPSFITAKIDHTIYLPSKLPGNFTLEEKSFQLVENDSVLLFKAQDGVTGEVIFTEQAKPKNFDFQDFYKNQMKDAKVLDNVPYPSFWGKLAGGRLMLSVVTKDTWILATTSVPLEKKDLVQIAAGIEKY